MFRKELINTETDTTNVNTNVNTDVNTKIEKGMITMFKNKTMRFLTIATVAGVLAFTPAVAKAPELNNTVVTETVANAAANSIETKYFTTDGADGEVFASYYGEFTIKPKADYTVIFTVDGSEPKLGSKNTTYIKNGETDYAFFTDEKIAFKFKAIKDTKSYNKNKAAFETAKTYTKHYNFTLHNFGALIFVEGNDRNDKITVDDFGTKYVNGTLVCRDNAKITINSCGKAVFNKEGNCTGFDKTQSTPVTYTLDGNTHTVKANTRKEITVKTPGKHTFSYINPETGEKIVKNFYVDTMTIKSKKGKFVTNGLYRMSRNIVGYKYYDAVFTTYAVKPSKKYTATNFELKNDKVVKADGSTFVFEKSCLSLNTIVTFNVKAGQKLNLPYNKFLKNYGFELCDH